MYIFLHEFLMMGITARYSTDRLSERASRVIIPEGRSADDVDDRDQDSQRFPYQRRLPLRVPPRSVQRARVRHSHPWVHRPDKLVMVRMALWR